MEQPNCFNKQIQQTTVTAAKQADKKKDLEKFRKTEQTVCAASWHET